MTKDVTSRDTTGDTTARLRAAFAAHGLGPSTRRPTRAQVDRALDVLGWLHENTVSGADRDAVSLTRHLLDESRP